jgi:hypothetical protein
MHASVKIAAANFFPLSVAKATWLIRGYVASRRHAKDAVKH